MSNIKQLLMEEQEKNSPDQEEFDKQSLTDLERSVKAVKAQKEMFDWFDEALRRNLK